MRKPIPTLVNVTTLFKKTVQLEIPVYQRDYAWKVDDATAFFGDYLEFIEKYDPEDIDASDNIHFLGAIYLAKSSSNNGVDLFGIVDGQQRITSLVLLVNAVKRTFRHIIKQADDVLNPSDKVQLIKQMRRLDDFLYTEVSVVSDKNLWSAGSPESFKLLVSEDQKSKFVQAINDSHPKSNLNYAKVIRYFRQELLDLYENHEDVAGNPKKWFQKFVKPIFEKIQVLRVELANIEDAYDTFERLNDRGVKLTIFELLNIKLLKTIQQNENYQKQYTKYRSEIIAACKEVKMKPSKVLWQHYLIKNSKVGEKEVPDAYSKKLTTFDLVKEEFDEILGVLGKYKEMFMSKMSNDNNPINIYRTLNTPFFKYPLAYVAYKGFAKESVDHFTKEATVLSWNGNLNSTSLGALYSQSMNSIITSVQKGEKSIFAKTLNNEMNGSLIGKTISNRSLIKFALFYKDMLEGNYTPKQVDEAEVTMFEDQEYRIENIREFKIAGKTETFDLEGFKDNISTFREIFENTK